MQVDPAALADSIRLTDPATAAAIDDALAAGLPISVSISARVEKFEGDYVPGAEPVEVVEMEG